MGAILGTLPPWGGALGKLARAIRSVGAAVDNSTSDDDRVHVGHGARGELHVSLVDDDDLDEWGSGVGGVNQFLVTVEPTGTPNQWLVNVLGGTAQAVFGNVTMIPTVEEEPITIPAGKYCFISAVYKIIEDSEYVHAFDEELDFSISAKPNQPTTETNWWPIAVIDENGQVLQGHLGAIYLSSPRNAVDVPD